MRKFGLIAVLVLALATPVLAQYGGGFDIGRTIKHKDAQRDADEWFAVSNTSITDDALELAGYNRMRADYDVTGTDVSIVVNLQVSNDTIWVSGDSITITADSWDTFDLVGGKDYNFYVESVSASDTISIYVTGYNRN